MGNQTSPMAAAKIPVLSERGRRKPQHFSRPSLRCHTALHLLHSIPQSRRKIPHSGSGGGGIDTTSRQASVKFLREYGRPEVFFSYYSYYRKKERLPLFPKRSVKTPPNLMVGVTPTGPYPSIYGPRATLGT